MALQVRLCAVLRFRLLRELYSRLFPSRLPSQLCSSEYRHLPLLYRKLTSFRNLAILDSKILRTRVQLISTAPMSPWTGLKLLVLPSWLQSKVSHAYQMAQDLRRHFQPYHVVSEKISRDEKTGVSKEVGFARFGSRRFWEIVAC